jgi:hypothetical protein
MAGGVSIDTGGVDDFGKNLRKDTDGGFASAATRAQDLHAHGVPFGTQIHHGPIAAAKDKYVAALQNTEANLRMYPQAAAVLAAVAEQIAHDFAHADLGSAAVQQRIDNLIGGAIAQAQTALAGQRDSALHTMGPFAKEGQP